MENPTLGSGPPNVGKSDCCRLCMKTHEYYLNIFVSNADFKTSIGKAIEDLLVLKVAKDDNLPKMVCCPCVTKLMELREFKEMCMDSARQFEKHEPVETITCPMEVKGMSARLMDGGEGANVEKKSQIQNEASDPLAFDNLCLVKDEFLPMQLVGEATCGISSNSTDGESRVALVPNDFPPDPFDLENQTDTKEVYLRDPLGESDDCGEEDCEETECNQNAAVFLESKQLLIGDKGEVKEELTSTEVVGNGESHSTEIIDEGDSSDKGGPILLSDILAVMDMVYGCNNNGLKDEPYKESDEFRADTQGISQNNVLNNPSGDPMREEKLQGEHSTSNTFVEICFPEERVKKQKKNVKYKVSRNQFSQLNGRGRPVGNHEREQLCQQAVNTSSTTEYVCNYCSARYSEKKSIALHINSHMDGKKSANVLPKEFSPIFSKNLLMRNRGYVESIILETSNITSTQTRSSRKNEKAADEEFCRDENLGTEPYHSGTLLYRRVKSREEAAFVCDTCGIAFLKKSDLVKHVNVHNGLSPCPYQQKRVVTRTNFKPLKCDICGENFKNTKALKRHSIIHTGVKPFKCNDCGKKFTQRRHLTCHSALHTGVKRFKCNECGKMFTRKCDLKTHSFVHTGVKPFKCNECGKMFTRKGDLKTHTFVHTGVKPFKCNECGKMFTTSSNLNKHSVVHTGVKRFKCYECGKMFTRRGNLKTHSVVHTGVKLFKCNECGKMFTTSRYLNMHSVVHTGVKQFKCSECGKMFTRKSDLNEHTFVHTGVKPFKCNECGKMFSKSCNLSTHSRIHSGVKPFKCNYCGKMFNTSSALKSHSVMHTGAKPFKCDFCGEQFKWRSGFNRHLLSHADRNPSK